MYGFDWRSITNQDLADAGFQFGTTTVEEAVTVITIMIVGAVAVCMVAVFFDRKINK